MISSSFRRNTPLVVIYNNLELFATFLKRSNDSELIHTRYYRGDRAIFWLGDPKLVVTSSRLQNPKEFCVQVGYPGTQVITPAIPTTDLSLDVLREPELLHEIICYAGPQKTLILVPYATTRPFLKLVNILRKDYGLTIQLPESPEEDCLWVRDFVDTKSGFRALAASCLPDSQKCLPEGYHCSDRRQAAGVAFWFNNRNIPCVVKADHGESGLGHQIILPGKYTSPTEIFNFLTSDPFLDDDLIMVEELIHSSQKKSPSLEVFVPAAGSGDVCITYLSEQLFNGFGNFSGVLIAAQSLQEPWYPKLAEYGLILARNMQKMGYQGHFDLDAVIDDQDQVWLLEINSRRTGGTFVHEYARFILGDDYLEKYVILSHNKIPCKDCGTYESLKSRLGNLTFPIQSEPRGILITVISALAVSEFGCFFIDTSVDAVKQMYETFVKSLASGK